jgi:uncharacterized coiled-coil protein SlyX
MKLEETMAHMTMANEELSAELIHTKSRIESLERKVVMLESRFAMLEDTVDAPVPNEKPPHW